MISSFSVYRCTTVSYHRCQNGEYWWWYFLCLTERHYGDVMAWKRFTHCRRISLTKASECGASILSLLLVWTGFLTKGRVSSASRRVCAHVTSLYYGIGSICNTYTRTRAPRRPHEYFSLQGRHVRFKVSHHHQLDCLFNTLLVLALNLRIIARPFVRVTQSHDWWNTFTKGH